MQNDECRMMNDEWAVGNRRWGTGGLSPEISCTAQNASILERRLAVGFALAMTLKAD
jgi:hypothetical protein